jgi:GNAT superfamily N-acetyltransferase
MAADAPPSPLDLARFARANEATWPPVEVRDVAGWRVRLGGEGAGRRATSAEWAGPGDPAAGVEAVLAAYREAGRTPRFQVWSHQPKAERALEAAGLGVEQDCDALVRDLASDWPRGDLETRAVMVRTRVALLDEIWARGGMTPARQAVFERAAGPRAAFLGRVGQRPAGAVGVSLDGEVAVTQALWVEPQARRSGLGSTLMAAIAAFAAGHGARVLAHAVEHGNEAALAFYARHGFARIGGYRYRAAPA